MPALFSRRRMRTAARAAGGLAAVGVLGLAAYFGTLWFTGNFGTVVAGEFYRSGQLSASQIAGYEKTYGFRTIVNLRGENTGRRWYDAEVAESTKLGITHIDFRMSAKRELTQAQAANLIGILARARKPILVHCEAGADRSGLASALYVAAVDKLGERAAESQISIRYGHVSLPISAAFAMDRTFEALEPWLGFPNS